MHTTASPWATVDGLRMLPLRNILGVEVFTDPIDAEARYNYWQNQGQKNIWIHYVRQASFEDMRQPLTVGLPLKHLNNAPLYLLVRVS